MNNNDERNNEWYPFTDREQFGEYLQRVEYGDNITINVLGYEYKAVQAANDRDALMLSAAKWHPERGKQAGESVLCTDVGSCGCCSIYFYNKCGDCPLNIGNRFSCVDDDHPYRDIVDNGADSKPLFDLICSCLEALNE